MPDSHLDVYIRPPIAKEDAAARARANQLAGTSMQLTMGQLLTDEFLRRHTLFISIPDLVSGVGFDVYEVDVDALPDAFKERLNGYLRDNSKFDSWDSLLLQATADWTTGYLQGVHELDGPHASYAALPGAEAVPAAEIKGPLENIDFRKVPPNLMEKLSSLGLAVYASYPQEPPVYVMEVGNVKFVFARHEQMINKVTKESFFRLVGQAPSITDTRTLAELFVLDPIEIGNLQFREAAWEFGVSLLPLGAAAIAFQKEGITSMEGWVSLGADVAGVLTFGATKGINALRAAKTGSAATRSVLATLKTAATANMIQLVFRGERALRKVQITGLALMTGELVFRGVEMVAAAAEGDMVTTAGKAGEVILRIAMLGITGRQAWNSRAASSSKTSVRDNLDDGSSASISAASTTRVTPTSPTQITPPSLRPSDFGLRTISEDADVLSMWNNALKSAATSTRPNGYTRYLQAIDGGLPMTKEMIDDAFQAVNSRFMSAYRASGRQVYAVHHWNFDRNTFPLQIVDPRHLALVQDRATHEAIHRATSSTTDIWAGPIDARHVLPIPNVATPLTP